jgi:hypothetical protein
LLILSTVVAVMTSPLYEEYKEIEAAHNVSVLLVRIIGCYRSLMENQ